MQDDLEYTPCEQRPRLIPVLPGALPSFRSWPSLRWFLLLQLPVVGSATASLMRGRPIGGAAMIILLGLATSTCLFAAICSRISSSNVGTYFRSREPIRF